MAETVTLHGGPWHGRIVTIEQGSCFTIAGEFHGNLQDMLKDPTNAARYVGYKEGHYSRVGNSHDFEWDGWRDHG